jgi:hypothetical protein
VNVERLRWVRASPLRCFHPAELLVQLPDNPAEGFVACSGPHRNLVVLGASFLADVLCMGWPFDNAQLFANLLTRPSVSPKGPRADGSTDR